MVRGDRWNMGHRNMHKMKREAQLDPTFASSIPRPDATGTLPATAIVSDGGDGHTGLTSIIETLELPITQPGTTATTTTIRTITVTDPAVYSSLKASESSARATSSTSSSSSATSSATTKSANTLSNSSSSNLGTLIPAIVIPVAIVLIASFAVFWFLMRRRHKRQLEEEPEFVMANKNPEKPAISRGNSNSSGTSSTRELVPMSKLEKEVAVATTSEIRKPSIDLFPPKYTSTDIGLARPMTPPDKADTDKNGNKPPVRNFSRGQNQRQSQDISKTRAEPIPRSAGRSSPLKSSRGPSPAVRGPPNYPVRPTREDGAYMPPRTRSPHRGGPNTLATNMHNGNRAPPPKSLHPNPPTGAFNGSSPISQYSPIVKDRPNIGNVVATEVSDKQSRNLARLATSNLGSNNEKADSPIDENILSHENMRIARLANSSRLGFSHSPVEPSFPRTTAAHPNTRPTKAANVEPPATSPQLPPPLSREEMPRAPFAQGPHSPAGASSVYASPSIGPGQTPRIGGGPSTFSLPQSVHTVGVASSTAYPYRASIVSRLSSDDGYVDMEMDAKSDVSSLDEREKWEMESDRREAESRLGTGYQGSGYGSAAMSPVDGPAVSPPASTTAKPNLRDRDSEGPFVLSRY